MKTSKKMNVNLNEVTVDFGFNVREQDVTSYDSPNMRDSLATMGQQTVAKLEKVSDKQFRILAGNRRTWNMQKLAKDGVIDPKTIKRDEKGNPIPNTGKVFSTIEAEVYENLTPTERLELMIDEGATRSLSKSEVQFAAERAFDAQYGERETVILLGDLLDRLYPPTRPIKAVTEDAGKDRLDYYKGVLQTMKRAYQSPVVLREAYLDKLRGKHTWPTNKELTEMHVIHVKEVADDKTGKINRINPGPKFTAHWTKYLEAQTAAMAEGANKAKAQSMPNRSAVEEMVKGSDSRIMKAVHNGYLRKFTADVFVKLDKLCSDLEANLTPAQVAVLDEIFANGEPTAEAIAEEQKA